MIIEKWEQIIAVDKPAGWLTIPGRGSEVKKVLSHEVGNLIREGKPRIGKNDLFVVHRLDEGTSGVVLFALTPEAHKELNHQFECGKIKKEYVCVVKGAPRPQLIDAPLFKLPSKKNKSVVDQKGKPSQTRIEVIQECGGLTLVRAFPQTGRPHQIRVHLAHIGCPLVGDTLYGGPSHSKGYPLLHAHRIEIEFKGQKLRVESPLPSWTNLATLSK